MGNLVTRRDIIKALGDKRGVSVWNFALKTLNHIYSIKPKGKIFREQAFKLGSIIRILEYESHRPDRPTRYKSKWKSDKVEVLSILNNLEKELDERASLSKQDS